MTPFCGYLKYTLPKVQLFESFKNTVLLLESLKMPNFHEKTTLFGPFLRKPHFTTITLAVFVFGYFTKKTEKNRKKGNNVFLRKFNEIRLNHLTSENYVYEKCKKSDFSKKTRFLLIFTFLKKNQKNGRKNHPPKSVIFSRGVKMPKIGISEVENGSFWWFWGSKSRSEDQNGHFWGSKNRKNPIFGQKTDFLPFCHFSKNRKNPVFCQKTDFFLPFSKIGQKQTLFGLFCAKSATPNRWYIKWGHLTPYPAGK